MKFKKVSNPTNAQFHFWICIIFSVFSFSGSYCYIMMRRKTAYKWQLFLYLLSKITGLFQIKRAEFMKIPVTFRGGFLISRHGKMTDLDLKGNWNFYIFWIHISKKKNLLELFFRLLNKFLNTVSGSEQVVVWIIQALKNDTY